MLDDNMIDIPKNINEKILDIKNNSIDSSVNIAFNVIEVYESLLKQFKSEDINHYRRVFIKIGLELVKAQPDMAVIFNFVNIIFNKVEKCKNKDELIRKLKKICKIYKEKLLSSNQKISIHTNKIIKKNYKVLTHSFSQTVLDTLYKSYTLGKNIDVFVTESRPKKEGILFAKNLTNKNISTTLIVDAAAYNILKKIDIVLIGADKITSEYVINKIGTYGLALSAKKMNIPCYVLCGTQKIIEVSNEKILKSKRQNPKEVLSNIPKNLYVENIYFENTPIDFFSNIITENGIVTTSEIKKYVDQIIIHPKLKSYI